MVAPFRAVAAGTGVLVVGAVLITSQGLTGQDWYEPMKIEARTCEPAGNEFTCQVWIANTRQDDKTWRDLTVRAKAPKKKGDLSSASPVLAGTCEGLRCGGTGSDLRSGESLVATWTGPLAGQYEEVDFVVSAKRPDTGRRRTIEVTADLTDWDSW